MQRTDSLTFGQKYKAVLTIAIIGVAACLTIFSVFSLYQVSPDTSEKAAAQGLSSFQSYSQLQNFVAANAKSASQYERNDGSFSHTDSSPVLGVAGPETFAAESATASAVSSPSFTGTNNQVQGVDEPDIIKTDGTHLFVATSDTVAIINAYPPNSTSTLSTLSFRNANVLGIEIAQNRLLVIDQQSSNLTHIELLLYVDSNLSSPQLLDNMSVAGTYVSARLAKGYFYAVVQEPSYEFDSEGNVTGVMPSMIENGLPTILPPSSVYYTANQAQVSYYTLIISINVSSGKESTLSVLTGPSSTIYVSTSNIYVVYANYQEFYADGIPGDVFTGGVISQYNVQSQNSTIIRASYSNGTFGVESAGSVPGTVLNQFSLDEYNNYFRVATSRFTTIGGTVTTSNDVYVLDMNMSQVSAIQNIAPGENIYAVSFVGDMGYVVTYEQVDPLFAISFQDMMHPVILSALKVTGYSDYLYPLPGGYLIGVGKDAVASSTGNFSYYLGLKLSLFHVSLNGSSIEVSRYLIGDRGTDSPVLNDHLAFTFDPTRNITVIPVLLAEVNGNQSSAQNDPPFGNDVWQGAYVFNVNTSGFTLLGRVSQYPSSQNNSDSLNNNLDISRSVIIGNYLYTVSQSEVMVSDLASFSTVATILLPES